MSNFPSWVIFIATIAIYVVPAMIAWGLFKTVRDLRKKYYATALIEFSGTIGVLYFWGLAFKVSAIGPEFLRFHLADIGFPVALALLISSFAEARFERDTKSASIIHWAQELIKLNQSKMKLVIGTFGASVVYEIFAGFLVATLNDRGLASVGVGGFDWIDIVCYVVGAGVFYLCLRGSNYSLNAGLVIEQRYREAVRASRTPVRPVHKYKKPRKRRGVR